MSQEQTTAQQTAASEAALQLEYAIPPPQRFNPLRWARREPVGAFGLFLIGLIVFFSAAAPVLNTKPPNEFAVGPPLGSPSADNWFGTTARGKDVWSRVLFAGRISLKIGVATVLLGTFGGTLIALVSAYAGGAVDFAVGRFADMLIAIPGILLALVLHASISADLPDLPGPQSEELYLVVAISLFFIPGTYRIMRGTVLELRESTYVEAAQVVGSSNFRIMWRHVAPNMFGLMIVITSISASRRHPRRGEPQLPRSGCPHRGARCRAFLGRRPLRQLSPLLQRGALARDLPWPRPRHHRLRLQYLRRFPPGYPRSEAPRSYLT